MDMSEVSKKLNQLLNKINEQAPPEEIPEEEPIETPLEEIPEEEPIETPPEGMGGMGTDPMVGGMMMPGEEPVAATTAGQIGKVYEMKKIFARLTSLENNLSMSSDVEIIKLRKYVVQAIELFKVMISNLKMFMDRIDDIIVTYYKFLDVIYSMLEKYYKNNEQINNK